MPFLYHVRFLFFRRIFFQGGAVLIVLGYLGLRMTSIGYAGVSYPVSAPSVTPPAQVKEQTKQDSADSELLELQKNRQNQIQMINAVNPLSQDFNSAPIASEGLDPRLMQIKKVYEWTQTRQFQALLAKLKILSQDARFLAAANDLRQSPQHKYYLAAFVLLFFVSGFLKHRIFHSTDRFFIRVVLRFALFLGMLFTQFLVAYLFYGQPFFEVLLGFRRVFLSF